MKDFFSTTLKFIIYTGIFIIPFIALFIYNNLYFPFITSKAFLFYSIIQIIFFAWVILAFKDHIYRPKISFIFISLLSFLVFLTLAAIFGVNSHNSFWSNFERMEGVILHFHLFAYFLVISSVFHTRNMFYRLFNTSIIVSVVISTIGLFQRFGDLETYQSSWRIESMFGNAAYLAVYLLFHIFIVLFLLINRSKDKSPLLFLYYIALPLQLITLFFTATRSAMLGLIVGMFVFALIVSIFEKDRINLKKVSISVLLICILLVSGFLVFKESSFVKNTPQLEGFTKISFEEFQNQGRYFVWPMAIKGFLERPVLGWGSENFMDIFNREYDPRMHSFERWFDRAHNSFLDFLFAGGILTFLAYLSIFFFAFYYIWKREKTFSVSEGAALSGLLVAYMVNNFFIFDNLFGYIIFFTVSSFINLEAKSFKELPEKSFKKEIVYIVTVFSIILLVISFYFIVYKPFKTNTLLISAMRDGRIAQSHLNLETGEGIERSKLYLRNSLEKFQEALSLNTYGNAEIVKQLIEISKFVYSDESISEEIRIDFLNLVISESEKLLIRNPKNVFLMFNLSSFLNDIGEYEKALEYTKESKKLSPKKQDIYFLEAFIYLGLGEKERAFEIFEEAYNLEPSFNRAIRFYLVGALEIQNEELITELFNQHKEVFYFDNNILNSLVSSGHFNEVLEIWKIRVKENPNDRDFRLSLAAAYYELGQIDNAIESIREAIRVSEKNMERVFNQNISEEEKNKVHQEHQSFEISALNLIGEIRSGSVIQTY